MENGTLFLIPVILCTSIHPDKVLKIQTKSKSTFASKQGFKMSVSSVSDRVEPIGGATFFPESTFPKVPSESFMFLFRASEEGQQRKSPEEKILTTY